jgi:hypothetical protein
LKPILTAALALARYLVPRAGSKSAPPVLTGGQWTGTSYIDSYKRHRDPNPNELMAELKGVAWACIT